MKNMVNILPMGACPKCAHKQFIVIESVCTGYLTNEDGSIIDANEYNYMAVGRCCNCNTTFDMMPTSYGFIPMTNLRKIIYDYVPHSLNERSSIKLENNPMYNKKEE